MCLKKDSCNKSHHEAFTLSYMFSLKCMSQWQILLGHSHWEISTLFGVLSWRICLSRLALQQTLQNGRPEFWKCGKQGFSQSKEEGWRRRGELLAKLLMFLCSCVRLIWKAQSEKALCINQVGGLYLPVSYSHGVTVKT